MSLSTRILIVVGVLAVALVRQSTLARLGQFMWHATAAQRAEAFLRAIGKWKDVA